MQPKANDYYYAANLLKMEAQLRFPALNTIARELEEKAAAMLTQERNHAA